MDLLSLVGTYGPYIASGLQVTLALTVLSLIGSMVGGLLLMFARLSSSRLLRGPATVYIEAVRGTPIILVVFIVYFGLARYGLKMPPFPAAVVAFSVNGAAFMSEIFRSGILSVDEGQKEAAKALGMSYGLSMRRIVLPQAFYVVLPPVANFGIGLLKQTSVALMIAVPEITYRAYNSISLTFRSMELLSIAAILYLCMSIPLSKGVEVLERRLEVRK
jgi:His/Glu/Gln/Arg/opine family amino acid ABC transporter permease subunit